ncbi:hypothetical protein WME75_00740 [Sorangium sp. So ce1014]|uniref:hypothetical protein n=1 Tax=Sorangium sp. So ce1014 TaxID=3133326 RepID=UPI003F638371
MSSTPATEILRAPLLPPRPRRASRPRGGPAPGALAWRSAPPALALSLLLSGCGASDPPEVRVSGCPRCAGVTQIGALPRGDIDECSGVVAGGVHPDALYVHNDHGDDARFFAIGLNGALRAEVNVAGAAAIDWEDIARGPCRTGGGSCLFLADIGDNDGERASYTVYSVPEPDTLGGAPQASTAEAFVLSYPDGRHDAETLLIHPTTGALTLVTKVNKGISRIYELPALPAAGAPATLVGAGSIQPPSGSARFTGGDVRPDGTGVLLRTSSRVLYYPMTPDQTVAQALAGSPCVLPSPDEEQAEAIAWVPGGWDYVTIGEGKEEPIHRVSCQAP